MAQALGSSSVFDDIVKAEATKGGLYFTQGTYEDLEILGVKLIKARSGPDLFIVETLVIKSSGGYTDEEVKAVPTRKKVVPVGMKPAWTVKMSLDNALGDVKEFIAKAFNIPTTDVDPAGAKLAVSDSQPLRGYHMKALMFDITTKKGGNFTRAEWTHLSLPVGGTATPPAAAPAAPKPSDEQIIQARGAVKLGYALPAEVIALSKLLTTTEVAAPKA